MNRRDVDRLDPSQTYWVPTVVAPYRGWAGAPASRKGARFIVNPETFHVSREEFETFDSELSCLRWIMRHRLQLNRALPGARIRVVRLDHWLLGLD